jgi:hypothetical protein
MPSIQHRARKLEEMTHEELPWRKTPQSTVISLDLLRDYFSPLVEAGRKGGQSATDLSGRSSHFASRVEKRSRPVWHRTASAFGQPRPHARPALIGRRAIA